MRSATLAHRSLLRQQLHARARMVFAPGRPALAQPNQIISRVMRAIEARRKTAVATGIAMSGHGSGVLLAGAAIVLAAITASVLVTGSAEFAVLATLIALAVTGVFFIFGLLSGFVRLDERATASEIHANILAGEADGLQVVADGAIVYANPAVAELLGTATATIEEALAGDPVAADAVYRLALAAERGERRVEDIRQRPTRAGEARWLRIGVRPFTPARAIPDARRMTVWHIADISAERRRTAGVVSGFEQALAYFDNLPVGLFALAPDSRIRHVNAALAGWLQLKPEAGRTDLALADILTADNAALVLTASRRAGGAPQRFDLDLVRDNGQALPAELIVWPADAASRRNIATVLVLARSGAAAVGAVETGAEARFSRLFHSAPFGMATVGKDGTIVNVNAAFTRLYPEPPDAGPQASPTVASVVLADADPESRASVATALERACAGRAGTASLEVTTASEPPVTRRLYIHPLTVTTDPREAVVMYVIDASEQKALEIKFAQSQKMEAIGQLAGGIAHDFNNVLTVIVGLSDMLLQGRRATDPGHTDLMQIKQNANRAAGMVSQLLAFSRKQKLAPRVLALNDLIQDFGYSLNKYVGEKVDLKHTAGRDLWYVKADSGQFEQVLMNLTLNARDAMPGGGRLMIRTRNVSERESLKLPTNSIAAGEYVLIEVEDTGSGMPPDVMARIFEPFYSTKDVGKGTGLGLSTVYGIIKQTGGYIFPESTPGKGTTFRIYLPRHVPDSDEEVVEIKDAKKPEPARDLTGSGRVLLVEDEDGVRSFAMRALQRQGYEVLEAASGQEALEVLAAAGGRVDLVVSDVIMPEMDGPTMYTEMRRTRPDLKIIFVSGYPSDAFEKSLDPDAPFAFLPKPFTLSQLAAKVKEQLEG